MDWEKTGLNNTRGFILANCPGAWENMVCIPELELSLYTSGGEENKRETSAAADMDGQVF